MTKRHQIAASGVRIGYDQGNNARPDFIMVGTRTPRGYRLYACKDIPEGASFGLGEIDYQAMWQLHADGLANVLTIDGTSYGDCLNKLFRIWTPDTLEPQAIEGQRALSPGKIEDSQLPPGQPPARQISGVCRYCGKTIIRWGEPLAQNWVDDEQFFSSCPGREGDDYGHSPLRTKSGRVLTRKELDDLAAEAERGYGQAEREEP